MLNKEDIQALKVKATKKVVYDEFVKIYKARVEDDPQKFFQDYVDPESLQIYDSDFAAVGDRVANRYVSNTKLSTQKTVAIMVTFRPEEGKCNEWIDLVKKIIKPGKGVLKAICSLEQSGETEDEIGYGVHLHAVIQLNKDDQNGQFQRQATRIRKIFEGYRTKTDKFLDIKKVGQELLSEKIDYVMGKKYDEDKHLKVQMDEIWRKEKNYPRYWVL